MRTRTEIASEGCYTDRAIVLHTIKYSETKLIVHLLTKTHGRISAITTIKRSSRHTNTNTLQPLTPICFQANKTKGAMHRLTNCEPTPSVINIVMDVTKSTIALFVCEMLYRLVREPMDDIELYNFVETSILELNEMNVGVANFHIWFLVHFAYFMGYELPEEYNKNEWLDIKSGTHTMIMPVHPLRVSPVYAEMINLFRVTQINDIHNIKLNKANRKIILNALVDYYAYHCDTFTSVRSIEILSEVF